MVSGIIKPYLMGRNIPDLNGMNPSNETKLVHTAGNAAFSVTFKNSVVELHSFGLDALCESSNKSLMTL